MRYLKKNWNQILNNFIASMCLILVAVFVGVCFITPTKVSAAEPLTKSQIIGTGEKEYNMYFVSAKTKARSASSMDRSRLNSRKGDNPTAPSFYTYEYNYNNFSDTNLYHGAKSNLVESEQGNVSTSLSAESSLPLEHTVYEYVDSTHIDGFIPYGVTHIDNVFGEKEPVFYDEISHNDFVLLNNYNSHNQRNATGDFNVENFYIAMGTPYFGDGKTTPLNELKVSANLYSEGQTHHLVLNEVRTTKETEPTSNHYGKEFFYWNQYLDLTTLLASESAQAMQADTYYVENPQGRYEFTFTFTRYDDKLEAQDMPEETFVYSFYLLDGTAYSEYPEMHNATLVNSDKTNETNEYLYNFTKDLPYVTYDPSKYSLEYTRINNKSIKDVSENIYSVYTTGTYTFEDKNNQKFPKNKITFYNGKNVFKEVFILTNYNNARSVVEQIFLSRENPTSVMDEISSYKKFEDFLADGTLKFEYKLIKVLTTGTPEINGTKETINYTINTYRTNTYTEHNLLVSYTTLPDFNKKNSKNLSVYNNESTEHFTKVSQDNTETTTITNDKLITVSKDNIVIAKFGSNPESEVFDTSSLINTDGTTTKFVAVKSDILTTIDTVAHPLPTEADDDLNVITYALQVEENEDKTAATYTLMKTSYGKILNGSNYELQTKTVEISIPNSTTGDHTIADPFNPSIVIAYSVDAADEETKYNHISTIQFINESRAHVTEISNDQAYGNMAMLEKVIEYNKFELSLDFTYDYYFDELGIHDITYSYVSCADNAKYYINSTTEKKSNNNYSGSTTKTIPENFATIYANPTTTYSTPIESNLYVVVSGEIGKNNSVVLNGKTYTYTQSSNTLVIGGFAKTLDSNNTYTENTYTLADNTPIVRSIVYKVKSISAVQNVLEIAYGIGTVTTTTTTTTSTSITNPNHKKLVTLTKQKYSLESGLKNRLQGSDWDNLRLAMQSIYDNTDQAYIYPNPSPDTDPSTDDLTITESATIVQTTTGYERNTQGRDRLHIFGSIAYFNRADANSDSTYTKLEQVDNKLDVEFRSDVTKDLYTQYNDPAQIKSFINEPTSLKGRISALRNKDNIIITDVTPILWNNFSTLLYDGKISKSYVFRYTDYTMTASGVIPNNTADVIQSKYNKDMYCQFDGLYEVVILYSYDNEPTDSTTKTTFMQVFTFIIDNSSPELTIEVWQPNEEGTGGNYVDLGLNKYTNKDVRLSWRKPTYFQNDVYLEIDKTYFNASNTGNNFVAIYQQNKITCENAGKLNYINNISKMGEFQKEINGYTQNFYYVELKLQQSGLDKNLANGNYKIIVHYNSNGNATFSEEFVIDKMDISNMKVLPVYKTTEGFARLNDILEYDKTAQIINYDFTFRFNRKESNANIFVYYDKIELANSNNFDKIINAANDMQGITTKFEIPDNAKLSKGTQYIYNYTHDGSTPNFVENENYLTSNNSCIYLFRLVDEAGNEARYVVFYDKTQPRFLVSPSPDPITNIVNDTTRVVWGDYKAIEVTEDTANFVLDFNEKVSNYPAQDEKLKKSTDSELSLMLRYMTTNSKYFNDLKVEKIDFKDDKGNITGSKYYVLIPIHKATIEDADIKKDTDLFGLQDYYFFPVNPIETRTNEETNATSYHITLPKYNEDGSVVTEDNIVVKEEHIVLEYSVQQVLNTKKELMDRTITLTYIDSNTDEIKTIRGNIGEGSYFYSVLDKLKNKTTGIIWMNLDMTETMAFGMFDYSDDINKSISLSTDTFGTIGNTYSASKIHITSKAPDAEKGVPEYSVTYLHYAYNLDLYQNYDISKIELEKSEIAGDKSTYLKLSMTPKGNPQGDAIVSRLQLTDEDGNDYTLVSYPFELQGQAIVADASRNPINVYDQGVSYANFDPNRRFSLPINTTTDTNKQKVVTEEGLYIFKRKYADHVTDDQIGDDKRIIYRAYYIDRNGIIDLSNGIGNNISFLLASDFSDQDYQKEITAETIQNNQTPTSSANTSNSDYRSSDLFETNKIQVEYTMSYDKYDFSRFSNTTQLSEYKAAIQLAADAPETDRLEIENYLSNFLFDATIFRDMIYNVDLQLKVDTLTIMDEANKEYSQNGIKKYINSTRHQPMTGGRRNNVFDFFYDNVYTITINDQAGYIKKLADNTVENDNYLANQLIIDFEIDHTAPAGDMYGKYYGRHDYDNNNDKDENPNAPSIPIENGDYAILSKYLTEGQLQPLSASDWTETRSSNGSHIELRSTNNETLIFTFTITNDDFRAQIDPNNIKIYKGGTASQNLIFNYVNGQAIATSLVSAERQRQSYITNMINGVEHKAIIVFDNNLDTILNDEEKEAGFTDYRLLGPENNPEKETYYVQINYLGDAKNYVGEDDKGNQISYYKSTFEIVVDRVKPTYNLTKLMKQDKYVYNTVSGNITLSNYEAKFAEYKPFYNYTFDQDHKFERSDLENYFFAIDTRYSTSFEFESVSELDNNNTIYIRRIDKADDYRFSLTPDDYTAYYNATYMQGHPQFTPSTSTSITTQFLTSNSTLSTGKYYKIQFSLDGNNDNRISAYFLKNKGIFAEDNYYEVIEEDEAGNYRTYAIYIPKQSDNKVIYSYQTNSSAASLQSNQSISAETPTISIGGMKLHIQNIVTKDYFQRALITIATDKINHQIDIILNPVALDVTVYNRTLKTIMWNAPIGTKNNGDKVNTTQFVEYINKVLDEYYTMINDKSHSYYSQYGYSVDVQIIDRIGVTVKENKNLYNYQIDYTVAGSTLSPTFVDNIYNFTMKLSGQKGSTYLTKIVVEKFNKEWLGINTDNSTPPRIFDRSQSELKKPLEYTFNRGVYKFIFVDNFNRTTQFFHEFGISSTQVGGALNFYGEKQTLNDGYTYTGTSFEYSYDSSVYNVFIKFAGKIEDEYAPGEYIKIEDSDNHIFFDSSNTYSETYLNMYGISVITAGNITTIRFNGVNDNSKISTLTDLSKYHIKTILASTATNYSWGAEANNKDIVSYDKKVALYTAIQNISIKNLSGNTLDTSEHLNLTEDFQVVFNWTDDVATTERFDFNSRIVLIRTYNENGIIKTTTTSVSSGAVITLAGDYTAYVTNNLGSKSKILSFTRGEGAISMYAVYAVNAAMSTEEKLSPSSLISTFDAENKVLFTYFVTRDYFNYIDTSEKEEVTLVTLDNISNYTNSTDLANIISPYLDAEKYLDVRVNSNLSIKTEIFQIGCESIGNNPYVIYRIYSKTKLNEIYTYRFVQVVFVDPAENEFANITVYNEGDIDAVNLADKSSLITSTANSMYIEMKFIKDQEGVLQPYVPYGDTLIIDRYYNGELAETTSINISQDSINTFAMNLYEVGLHEFRLRDLAGRKHKFYGGSEVLQIYLINEILFTVNDDTPINNQVFNGDVKFNVIFKLSGMQLYSDILDIKYIKNGEEVKQSDTNGEFIISGAGYYTVKMSTQTLVTQESSATTLYSTYHFVIVDEQIATRNFSISKGTNFAIDKIVKIVGDETIDITDEYIANHTGDSSNTLLWLTYEEQGTSKFRVTMKHFNSTTNKYQNFTFNIWINGEIPTIKSSVLPGTTTKEIIEINFNPGLIYTQIGKGYIELNGRKVAIIDETSEEYVTTLKISDKGTHILKIFTDDGTLISSYKFTKSEPLNSFTKTAIVIGIIALVVVIILFFLLRRKGKYR